MKDTFRCSICGKEAHFGGGKSHWISKNRANIYLQNKIFKRDESSGLYRDSDGTLYIKVRLSHSFPDDDNRDFMYCDECENNGKLDDFIRSYAEVELAKNSGGCLSVIIGLIFLFLIVFI